MEYSVSISMGQVSPVVNQYSNPLSLSALKNGNPKVIGAVSTTMTAILGFMASYLGNLIAWEEVLNSDMRFYPDHNLLPENVNYNTPAPVLPGEGGYYPVPVPGMTEVLRGV